MKRALLLLFVLCSPLAAQDYIFRANPIPDTTLTLSIGSAAKRWVSGDYRMLYTDSMQSRTGAVNINDSLIVAALAQLHSATVTNNLTANGKFFGDSLISSGSTIYIGLPGQPVTIGSTLTVDSLNGAPIGSEAFADSSYRVAQIALRKLISDSTALTGYVTGNRFLDSLDGKVPMTRTLTAGYGINTIGDLSANRTVSSDTTNATATTSRTGYLAYTDWNTFNNKADKGIWEISSSGTIRPSTAGTVDAFWELSARGTVVPKP